MFDRKTLGNEFDLIPKTFLGAVLSLWCCKNAKYLLFSVAVKVLNFTKKKAVNRPEYLQTL